MIPYVPKEPTNRDETRAIVDLIAELKEQLQSGKITADTFDVEHRIMRYPLVKRLGTIRRQVKAGEISKTLHRREYGMIASVLWGSDFLRRARAGVSIDRLLHAYPVATHKR
jgi:hypothetical protein